MRTLTRKTHWIIFLKALQSFLLQINQTWFLYHRLLLFRKIICHGFLEKKSHLQQVAFTQKHSPNTCNPYKLPAHKHGRYWVPNLVQKWQKTSTAFVEISWGTVVAIPMYFAITASFASKTIFCFFVATLMHQFNCCLEMVERFEDGWI